MMKNEYINVPKEKFEFVSHGEKIHDTKLDTKPIGYFKDALIRFRKNKSSVVAFGIIMILVLFAIIGPFVSGYTLGDRDGYYKTVLPKSEIFSKIGIWNGTEMRTDTKAGYDYYNSIGVESGMNAVIGGAERIVNKSGGVSYKFKVDSYYQVGYAYVTVTKTQYESLLQYQESTGKQIFYPMTANYATNYVLGNAGANLWYKLADEYDADGNFIGVNTATGGAALRDAEGNYQANYLTESLAAERDILNVKAYTGRRISADSGDCIYALTVQGGYKVRVNYFNYYTYTNGHEPCFLFGTNGHGQDIFTCLSNGARLSFMLAIFVSAINLTIGAIYGAIEGYYGGTIDIVMERISDILSSVPFIVVATLFQLHLAEKVGIFPSLVFAFILTGWVGMASRVRMQFYRFKGQEYVLAAKTLGASDKRIMFKHIFPNSLGTIITSVVLSIPGVIFSESMLTYLGIVNLNTSDTMTSIGTMLSQGSSYLTTHPHVLIFPAVFISLLEISFNLFGNGLRDAFNPSLRGVEE